MWALLLLLGASYAASGDETRPLTAILLVARAELPDSDFADSVVLVMNNLGPAPVGIIVNKPTNVAVSELFPDLKRLARLHDKVYFGGPVEPGSVWFLFRASKPPTHAIQACDGVYLSADRGLLLQLLGRDKPMDGLRIIAGHAGWAPGQLEASYEGSPILIMRALHLERRVAFMSARDQSLRKSLVAFLAERIAFDQAPKLDT